MVSIFILLLVGKAISDEEIMAPATTGKSTIRLFGLVANCEIKFCRAVLVATQSSGMKYKSPYLDNII